HMAAGSRHGRDQSLDSWGNVRTVARWERRRVRKVPERSPEFIEAISRGLSVIRAFSAEYPALTLSQVAQEAGLARPTARRILMTLQDLGYVRAEDSYFQLTPKVLELGMSYVGSLGLWDVA